jgi:hypothetical protein
MRVNALPADGMSRGVVNLRRVSRVSGGVPVPFGVAELSEAHVDLMKTCISDLVGLESKIRAGFKELFWSDPQTAGALVRRAFNALPGENYFLEKLIHTLTDKPDLCALKTILYRIDGLDGGNRIVVNEVNANPIGGFWLGAVHDAVAPGRDGLHIGRVPQLYAEQIRRHTGPGRAFFLPVRALDGSSSYTEKLILRDAIAGLDIDLFMGTPDRLAFRDAGVFVRWEGRDYRVGYVGGLSSPEVFMRTPELLDHISKGTVHCPSAVDSIVGLSNKGTFCVLTDMREGRLDPALLGLSPADIGSSSPIPNTYWLYDRATGVDHTPLFLSRDMVAKPLNGVGGKGVLLPMEADAVRSLTRLLKQDHLIQDYYPSFPVDAETRTIASLDPYFSNDGGAQIVGVLVRSAPEGSLPNLTVNSKRPDFDKQPPPNLFSLGVLRL